MPLRVDKFGDRKIAIAGIGELFFQHGFPISMSIQELKKEDIEVSILHVADECLKNGWSAKTTYSRLMADMEEDIEKTDYNLVQLELFCNSTYDHQRKMLYNYLFTTKEEAVKKVKNIFNTIKTK